MRSSHTLRGGRLPAALALIGLALLGLLFVPECDDCYFVYWSFDSLRDWLLTRPSTAGVEIVGVPENGRYLGNLLGVLQGKLYFIPVVGPILRGVLMGGALWALVYLLARRARRGPVGRGEAFSMALALVLLAPRGIWQEALSWGAGLVNYLLPMVILLVLLELFARRRPPSALLAGALAFCGCLFMETATILLAAAGACAGLLFRRSDRRRAALGLWLGSWLGALVMFTASGYRSGTNADRRMDVSLALEHLRQIVTEAVVFPAAAALLISVLLVWLAGKGGGRWRALALALVPLHLLQLWRAAENWLGEPRYDELSLGVGLALAAVWCLLLAQTRGTAPVWGAVLALGLLCGPLLFVTPIGPRNFLPPYVLLSLIALLLYREAREQGLPGLTRLAAPLSALALAGLVWVYGCNCLVYHQRLSYAREQAAAGAEHITLPLLPYDRWAINETVGKGGHLLPGLPGGPLGRGLHLRPLGGIYGPLTGGRQKHQPSKGAQISWTSDQSRETPGCWRGWSGFPSISWTRGAASCWTPACWGSGRSWSRPSWTTA